MTKYTSKIVCCLAAPIFISACGHSQNTSAIAQAASSGPDSGVAVASLSVVPGTVSACQLGTRISSLVSWDVKKPSISQVKVMVAGPGSAAPKLFSMGGFKGNAKTGDWVAAGTRFQLVDADSGTQLAAYTVTAQSCTAPK